MFAAPLSLVAYGCRGLRGALLFTVCSIVVLVESCKAHPRTVTDSNGSVRLRESNCVFARHTFDLFLKPVVSKNLVPSETAKLFERIEDLFDLACVKVE